jgi:hypothetical protein
MVSETENRFGKLIPDMALYHTSENHYDLLVKDNSRLALLGLLPGVSADGPKNKDETKKAVVDDCKTVGKRG